MKIVGIYKIVNRVNGKYYVGSSNNIFHRVEYRHKRALRENTHWNSHLQWAWNKYGEVAFDFIVVEEFRTPKTYRELWNEEQKWLDIARKEPHKCYNQSFIAGGVDFTPSLRKRMSVRQKKWLKEHGHPLKGTHPTQETLRRMSIAQTGKRRSKTAIQKISGTNSVAHREDVKQAKRDWWSQLKNDPAAYFAFCKSRSEKSRKAKFHYGKKYEVNGD